MHTTTHAKNTQHFGSTMDNSGCIDSTESELSEQEQCSTTTLAKTKKVKRPFSRKQKSSHQKRKKQRRKQCNESMEAEEEEEEIKESRQNFYRAIENNCDKYIPTNARGKFPMKEKIPKIIQLLTNNIDMPNCGMKHSLMKKWTVIDGKLCCATKKNMHGARKVTAYEDIFYQIFKVDKSKNFQRNIEGLAMDVKDESNNISKLMIQLYSENCHKRNHKVRGVTPKREKSKTQENEQQRKIDDFIQTLNDCTAVGYFCKQNDEIAAGAEHLNKADEDDQIRRIHIKSIPMR